MASLVFNIYCNLFYTRLAMEVHIYSRAFGLRDLQVNNFSGLACMIGCIYVVVQRPCR